MTEPGLRGRNRRVIWWACWLAILAAGLILKLIEPSFYGFGLNLDDQLMVVMAHGFLQGHWSTTWATSSFSTLVKPVGYPLFLAGVHFLPWSPVWSVYLVYVIGSTLIAWSWLRMRGSWLQATLLLAMLVFNPISFTVQSQRVYRELFIMALFTLAVGVAFVLASLLHQWTGAMGHRGDRAQLGRWLGASATRRTLTACVLLVVLGLIVGFAAITKETWTWVLPAAIAPLAYPLLQRLRPSRLRLATVLRVALAGLMFIVPIWGVINLDKRLDQHYYHAALVDDLSSGAFARAWKLWASVEAGHPERYVAITKPMREAVYRISPTAAKLEPYLESPTTDESGPWIEWNLLIAAYETGKVNSISELESYFNQIADDIARACSRGELRCSSSPVLATGLSVLSQIPLSSVASQTASGLWQMVWDTLPMTRWPTGIPSRATYRLWASVVPGMPPLAALTTATPDSVVYPIARRIDAIYRILDLALLATIALGLASWVLTVARRSRRASRHPDFEAGLASILFFASALFGMVTLALFAAVQGPTFVNSLYWTEFASIGQLSLIFGVFGLAPLLRRHPKQIDPKIPQRQPTQGETGLEPAPDGGPLEPYPAEDSSTNGQTTPTVEDPTLT